MLRCRDLQFPHHENELAQSQAAACRCDAEHRPSDFVRYWVHNGFVNVDEPVLISRTPLTGEPPAYNPAIIGQDPAVQHATLFLDPFFHPTALGHSIEPSFPANLALAATAIARGRLFGPLEAEEEPMNDPLRSVLVTGWGHWRGEGMAVVVPA